MSHHMCMRLFAAPCIIQLLGLIIKYPNLFINTIGHIYGSTKFASLWALISAKGQLHKEE